MADFELSDFDTSTDTMVFKSSPENGISQATEELVDTTKKILWEALWVDNLFHEDIGDLIRTLRAKNFGVYQVEVVLWEFINRVNGRNQLADYFSNFSWINDILYKGQPVVAAIRAWNKEALLEALLFVY